MIRKLTEEKIKAAFKLLVKHGMHVCVPGWYDLVTPAEAVEFARDKDKFYDRRG
jgi:hypothetical protein